MSEQIYTMIAQAKALHEACQLEDAANLYKQTLELASSTGEIPEELLDSYAELSNTTGDAATAISLFQESINRYPTQNPSKYFSLAQLNSGKQSLTLYRAGIEILKQNLSEENSRIQLATAYSAIAELHMSDLCDEENAEEICESSIQAAIEYDPNCIDAYQMLANLRLVRLRFQEAKEAMEKVKLLLEKAKHDSLPSIEFILESMRNLIEIEDFDGVLWVGDIGLSMDEDMPEIIYMQAFAHCKLGRKKESGDLIEILSGKMLDPELFSALEELKQELRKL
ncbi:unnamed protein product [Blepharisma stoltei]|uniref:Tetratricopeptide repeat protein n=1 Tax=Blepharisma stoltei TaxID=1481888 RepID=A0AAU9JV55_9CILI|nr:unnamed protein product [Blepharisma stoltei]